MCPHEFDVALCDATVKNVALSLSLAGHPRVSLMQLYCGRWPSINTCFYSCYKG